MVILILAVAAVIGSRSFLSPCIHEDGSFGTCHWAGESLMGLGCVTGVLAALCLAVSRARFGAYLSILPVCALGILTPGTLVGLCGMSTMRCRMIMQPAMMILFSAAFLCAAAGAVISAKGKQG